MSVYTSISPEQLGAFLQQFDLGELQDYEGITDGIENSNYFVNTTSGSYVLTLFEKISAAQLRYFFDLQLHLYKRHIPCPCPIADKQGQIQTTLLNRPAAIFPRLPGHGPGQINAQHCFAIGQVLGQIHHASSDFTAQRHNPRDLDWMTQTGTQILGQLLPDKAQLLQQELDYQNQNQLPELPSGTIHADLFRDNVLFEDSQSQAEQQTERLSAVLDLYDACSDRLLYDLAITVNDWCTDDAGDLHPGLTTAMLKGYQQERALTQAEQKAWSQMLRLAALRFWVSRLESALNPPSGELTQTKPPEVYQAILQQHIDRSD
ncbi:MAG: homoserine kinase [Gammaproteobacteria bacterium]|nr:homoserine kinase [Gammaproteobacteria bacterium]